MTLFKVITWIDDGNKCYTMKNVFHQKGWGEDTNPDPPIPLVKETSTGKPYGNYVKLKLRRDPMYNTSEIY